MARLDVKEATLKKLFALSGNECAFDPCPEPIVNEHGDLIGEVCHIEAANKKAPRYNPAQSDEQRRHFDNLLILCPTHHKTTDNVEVYPVARMRQMKRDHEARFAAAPLPITDEQVSRWRRQANEQLRRRLKDIAPSRLPHAAEVLVGRGEELKRLEAAWNAHGTHVIAIVAWGGVGKTALAAEWVGRFAARDWEGVDAYFDWSFYSQGTREQGAASADQFIAAALVHFGDEDPQAGSPSDRGDRLARLVAERRALLVLDGLEPLQYGPGPLAGKLKDPALEALLRGLAQRPFKGLCVLTSREPVADLARWHGKTVDQWPLEHLSERAGAELLHRAGANRAGAAAIEPDDAELVGACREVRGHALTLRLLGRYLNLAHGGDIRRRDRVAFEKADAKTQGGHAFRVIAAYERWLREEGHSGSREDAERLLGVLRLIGLFDRPADPGCLAALRRKPVIKGLTEPLFDWNRGLFGWLRKPVPMIEEDWNTTLAQLAELGLISPVTPSPSHPFTQSPIDSHPLVREYFARHLRDQNPGAWGAAHRRLYEHLCDTTEHWPEGIDGLQPLYQAVAHGCQAGLHQQACDDVYCNRILRGTGPGGNYSTFKLGAIGADLGAVACFFEVPWGRPSENLSPADRAWLLNEAAFSLRALGRLTEALEPMRVTLEINASNEQWKNAAVVASNLSELELTLGEISAALGDGQQSVTFADRTKDAFLRMSFRTTHADALHQAGRREDALRLFREAEAIQAEGQPEYPRLYSLGGFRYCDLLLADAERAFWNLVPKLRLGHPDSRSSASEEGKQGLPEVRSQAGAWERGEEGAWERGERHVPEPGDAARGCKQPPYDLPACTAACDEVTERATYAIRIAEQASLSLLDIALNHLTLGRAALYGALLKAGQGPGLPGRQDACPTDARDHLDAAVDGLRKAGAAHHIPRGLLSRAWLRFLEGDEPGARADLDEAWEIAERGAMRLHQADVQLTRARLFRDKDALAEARRLIQQTGYHRRDGELADAEEGMKDEG